MVARCLNHLAPPVIAPQRSSTRQGVRSAALFSPPFAMTVSKEGVLIGKILLKHGARPDLRLWRNETAVAWVGRRKGHTDKGDVVLFKGARRILAGLCVGSPDLVGVMMEALSPTDWVGIFLGLEVKTEGVKVSKEQEAMLRLLQRMGGVAAIVRSVEEVTALLGEPPK